ncbi:hypothetical protein [Salininema proteolyticum]|uniref:PH domain-containing protein n=1 Tax=Salininema proteolyticum TaxID=1607685 RepID=A0ABV8U3L2_9ACTN
MWIFNKARPMFVLRYCFFQILTLAMAVFDPSGEAFAPWPWGIAAAVVFVYGAPRALRFWPVARFSADGITLIPQFWGRPITVSWQDVEGIDLVRQVKHGRGGTVHWVHVAVRRRPRVLPDADRQAARELFDLLNRRSGDKLRKRAVWTVCWWTMANAEEFTAKMRAFRKQVPVKTI